MGMTVEFYSADPQTLTALFTSDMASDGEHEDAFLSQLHTYPVADFPFQLQLPEDLDNVCRFLQKQDSRIPSIFRDALVEQIWDDGPVVTESLTIVADSFVQIVAELNEHEMEAVARDWAATFFYREPHQQTPAYHALLKLQDVARDAVAHRRPLILYTSEI